ncbi:MAG: ArsR/SmtB family transcription factor [bacterium]
MTLELGSILTALADDTRRGAVEALGQGPLSAGELSNRLDVTPAALSRHLRVLRQADLVRVSLDPTDSRRHVYSVQPDRLVGLSVWAENVSRFWTMQLASYANHATQGREEIRGRNVGR